MTVMSAKMSRFRKPKTIVYEKHVGIINGPVAC